MHTLVHTLAKSDINDLKIVDATANGTRTAGQIMGSLTHHCTQCCGAFQIQSLK